MELSIIKLLINFGKLVKITILHISKQVEASSREINTLQINIITILIDNNHELFPILIIKCHNPDRI